MHEEFNDLNELQNECNARRKKGAKVPSPHVSASDIGPATVEIRHQAMQRAGDQNVCGLFSVMPLFTDLKKNEEASSPHVSELRVSAAVCCKHAVCYGIYGPKASRRHAYGVTSVSSGRCKDCEATSGLYAVTMSLRDLHAIRYALNLE